MIPLETSSFSTPIETVDFPAPERPVNHATHPLNFLSISCEAGAVDLDSQLAFAVFVASASAYSNTQMKKGIQDKVVDPAVAMEGGFDEDA